MFCIRPYFSKNLLLILFLISGSLLSATEIDKQGRMLISLLDYIGKDYQKAVDKGEVINEFEFNEMLEFSGNTVSIFKTVSSEVHIADSVNLLTQLRELRQLIANKAASGEVYLKSGEIRKELLLLDLVKLSPENWPNIVTGRALFLKNCANCHGEKGDGKNITFIGLNPVPASFLDSSVVDKLSPFQTFNTVRLGLPGTAMQAFPQLTDREVWDLAFYINSIRFEENSRSAGGVFDLIDLEQAATSSDFELRQKYPALTWEDLADLRARKLELIATDPLNIARRYLDEVLRALKNKESEKAAELALNAYLEGIEPIERIIMASDAELVSEVEKKMMKVRTEIRDGENLERIEASIGEARSVLDRVEELLSSQQHTLGFAVFMSSSILVREGLEAFLIIIAILGILKSLGASRPIYYIHGGWITAVLIGVVSWFFADWLMTWNVQSRELMEGIIALFAVFVLLYIGFWLHNKTEISKWKKFVEEKIKVLVHKDNMIGLAFFSFIVVFREVFESVIFLSSLSVEVGDENRSGIWIGIILAVVLVSALSWAILKVFDKVPLRKVFLFSSAIIVILAVIMTGEGIHAIQESGLIGITSFPLNLRVGFFGIFPTYETWIGQISIMAVIVLLWLVSRKQSTSTVSK